MGRLQISEFLLRQLTQLVRSGHGAKCAVLSREVVKHPDGVTYPVAAIIGNRPHVCVQWLLRIR
jgi:hypothetical protein